MEISREVQASRNLGEERKLSKYIQIVIQNQIIANDYLLHMHFHITYKFYRKINFHHSNDWKVTQYMHGVIDPINLL